MRKLTQLATFLVLVAFWAVPAEPQGVPSITGSRLTPQQAKQALDFHNKIRRDVGSPPLKWAADLAQYAQQWADHLAAENCSLNHRPISGRWKQMYGENGFLSGGGGAGALQAAQSWFGEKRSYLHEALSTQNFGASGHYSQMVWKTTLRLGMGQAVCKGRGRIVVIANYDPPGNMLGQTAY